MQFQGHSQAIEYQVDRHHSLDTRGLKNARFESELFLYQHVSNQRKEEGLKTKKLPLLFQIQTFCSLVWEFPPDTLIGGLNSMLIQLKLYSLKAENSLNKSH